jgi:hypothetical protein
MWRIMSTAMIASTSGSIDGVKICWLNHHQGNARIDCRSCGEIVETFILIGETLSRVLFTDAYVAATQGGEPPILECSNCGQPTQVAEEERCASCAHKNPLDTCRSCGAEVEAEKYFENEELCLRCSLARRYGWNP